MAITLQQLQQLGSIERVIIRSINCSLYQAMAVIDGKEQLIKQAPGKTLMARNIADIKEQLALLTIEKLILQHQSAYDEMIGQPFRDQANTLEVGLAFTTTNNSSDPAN
jgi:hypothetical protein